MMCGTFNLFCMKKLRNLIVFALFACAAVGCSDDDETSSVKIVYNPEVHAGEFVFIVPAGADSQIFTSNLSGKSGELIIPLNAGNYELHIPMTQIAFQVRSNHQLRINYTDKAGLVVEN